MLEKLAPTYPGEILLEEVMRPLGISIDTLAREINMSVNEIRALIHGEVSIDQSIAEKLEERFGMAAEAWLDLQRSYDEDIAGDTG